MLEGVVIDDTELFNDRLQEWEDFYNFDRPHGDGGHTPYERLREKTTSVSDDRQSHMGSWALSSSA
jgi:transposase InsO family protein